MMISLSALTYDPAGVVLLNVLPKSETKSITRRVNRSSTLDGGVAVNDFGYAVGDRTFTLHWKPSRALHESVARLVRLYGSVRVATDEGVFLAALEGMRESAEETTLTLLITEQLT